MATSPGTNDGKSAVCPVCGTQMRREHDGVRVPPMPNVFWFCVNVDCEEGRNNRLYSGG